MLTCEDNWVNISYIVQRQLGRNKAEEAGDRRTAKSGGSDQYVIERYHNHPQIDSGDEEGNGDNTKDEETSDRKAK